MIESLAKAGILTYCLAGKDSTNSTAQESAKAMVTGLIEEEGRGMALNNLARCNEVYVRFLRWSNLRLSNARKAMWTLQIARGLPLRKRQCLGKGCNLRWWTKSVLWWIFAVLCCSYHSDIKPHLSAWRNTSRKDCCWVFARTRNTNSVIASWLQRSFNLRKHEGSPRPTHARSLPRTSFHSKSLSAANHRALNWNAPAAN